MINSTTKEITSGVIALSGAVLIIVAAEVSLPVLAGFGAAAALGAGLYQAAAAPRRKSKLPADDSKPVTVAPKSGPVAPREFAGKY